MNVVIAGGTGLIGRAVISSLLANHHLVTVLSRKRADMPLPNGISVVAWNGRSTGGWKSAVDGADAVINLAGESIGSRWTRAKKDRIVRSRVDATNALIEAMNSVAHKPRVLVNASAVGYYGHVEEGEVTEEAPAGKDFLGQTCLLWEAAAMKAQTLGIRVVVMRNAFIFAREAEALRRLLLPFRLFVGGPFGSGVQWFPWVHIHDAAAAYRFAIENENLTGPVNLAAPDPVRVRDLAKQIGNALHRPSFLPAPGFALRLILGEMADLLLKGQQVIPRKLQHAGFTFRFPALESALRNVVQG